MGEGIRAILETMFKGYEAASLYFQNEGKDKIKKYFQSLFWIFVISFVPSLPLIYYGIFYDSSWALVIGGIWRAVCTLLLMLVATPVGLIYEIATGSAAGSGKRYIQRVSGVFISELLFTLIVSLIPISSNPKMFPIFILAALLFGFLGAMSMNRQAVSIFVGVLLFGIILSFYFPNAFGEAKIAIKGLDLEISKPTPIKYKLEDYKSGRVDFFYTNGEAKVWYVEVDGDKIELLNKKGFHTGVGIEAIAINRAVLEKLRKASWENLSPNNIIQEQQPTNIQPVPSPSPPYLDPAVPETPSQKKEEENKGIIVRENDEQKIHPTEESKNLQEYFVLRPTECRGDYGISLSVLGGEINPDGTIKVIFLQNAYNQVDYIAILNPEFDTYLTDETGNRYKFASIEGMAYMDVPNQRGRFNKLVKGVPQRYTITFNGQNKKPKTLNFTSTLYTPDVVGVLHFKKTVACSNIQIVSELREKKPVYDKEKDLNTRATIPNPFETNSRWVGNYVCREGLTNLTLNIIDVKENNIRAIFHFSQPGSRVTGSFYLEGQYDTSDNRLILFPGDWIDRPSGYDTVGMNGVILDNPRRYKGIIDHSGCGPFIVRLKN